MYLVIIVPPDDINGDLSFMPDLEADIEKAFASFGLEVHIEVVTDGLPPAA